MQNRPLARGRRRTTEHSRKTPVAQAATWWGLCSQSRLRSCLLAVWMGMPSCSALEVIWPKASLDLPLGEPSNPAHDNHPSS